MGMFLHSGRSFTLRASHHLCRFRESQILFVPNIALCQGKRLNICTKLWGSFDLRFQLADPVVTLCCVSQREAHTCRLSHSSHLHRTTPHARRRQETQLFSLWESSFFSKCVSYFLSAFLLWNELLTTMTHMYLHNLRCAIEAFKVFPNTFEVWVPGWWSSCRFRQ